MKTKITILLQSIFVLTAMMGFAQSPMSQVHGGEVLVPQNDAPCVSETLRNNIIAENTANIAQLRALETYQEPNLDGGHPLFIWPVAQASGHDYNIIYSLTNYIDHNTAYPNQVLDYNCGTRSYDTNNGYNHKGFDIISWPFWWKQMDLNQAVNIAAADGQIINKNDGSFDRNCSFNTNTPNYIAVQHDDGSQSWYLHMKDGSLTSKNIGDTVTAGEFLGVIGSSGSSTVPHLHFEVFDSAGELIDPSEGACNSLNNDTWWVAQKPYYEPAINAVLTHTDFPNFETCPNTEITNESNQFAVGATVFYGVYLKDQRAATQINLKITRPDGSVQETWDFNLTEDLSLSYWMWNFPTDMEGEWTWEATYMGETASHNYYVGVLSTPENELANSIAYPNPNSGSFTIALGNYFSEVNTTITNILGQVVASERFVNTDTLELNLQGSPGIYFVTISTAEGISETLKIIKR